MDIDATLKQLNKVSWATQAQMFRRKNKTLPEVKT
jgi:hypothetical protein